MVHLPFTVDFFRVSGSLDFSPAYKKMTNAAWGVAQHIGTRPYQEDRYVIAERFCLGYSLFAIMDGHGGDHVSEYVRTHIVGVVKTAVETQVDFNIRTALIRAYHTLHDNLPYDKSYLCGCTCVVLLLHDNHLWVANCGDSRAITHRGEQSIDLTFDHKPGSPGEMARIRRAGGDVIEVDGVPRVIGELAVSRSIGDKRYTPFVIASPDITYFPLSHLNRYVLLATDGLWDVMSTSDVDRFVKRLLPSRSPGDICNAVMKHAYEKLGTQDNVTILMCTRMI
jgi:serine/threonine protein phosphatase PrpC